MSELEQGTRVVLTDPDKAAMEADAMYGPMRGLHGEIEDYGYKTDFEAWYYTVRYDNGEYAISQRHELTLESEYEELKGKIKEDIEAQLRVLTGQIREVDVYQLAQLRESLEHVSKTIQAIGENLEQAQTELGKIGEGDPAKSMLASGVMTMYGQAMNSWENVEEVMGQLDSLVKTGSTQR